MYLFSEMIPHLHIFYFTFVIFVHLNPVVEKKYDIIKTNQIIDFVLSIYNRFIID